MEKLNKKTLSFPSAILKAVAALVVATTLAACGSNSGGNNYGGIIDCQNCAGAIMNPIALTNFTSNSYAGDVRLDNMTLFGDIAYTRPNHSTAYNGYNGPVAVQGTLVLGSPLYCGGGIVPAGSYQITTHSHGSMMNGSNLEVPDMVAGPMRLRMTYSAGLSSLNPIGGVIRWTGALEVTQINGYACAAYTLML